MKRFVPCIALVALSFLSVSAQGGVVSGTYFDLAVGTDVDLTAEGTLDWIKWGNGEHNTTTFFTTTKIGNPVFDAGSLTALGTPPDDHDLELVAFTGFNILNFFWTDGNFGMYNGTGPVDTVVTEQITPVVASYPIGLGASFQAAAVAQTRIMEVYVQGFNSDMLITASMSGGGSDSVVVTPSHNPASDAANDYAIGRFHIEYSGAGETLTVSVVTQNPRTDGAQAAFANAGFFAATVSQVPEPSSFALGLAGLVSIGLVAYRRHRQANG